MTINFCKQNKYTFWVNFTDCLKNIKYANRQIEELKSLVRQMTRSEDDRAHSRYKREIFNFIGGISKILLGTMDSEDASYYTDKISNLEREQVDFLKLSK
jgi:hypothetical protein